MSLIKIVVVRFPYAMKILKWTTVSLMIGSALGWFVAFAAKPSPPPPRDSWAKISDFVRMVHQADRVILFEGMPHGLTEKELLAGEKRSKRWRTIHGENFYTESQSVAMERRDFLSELETHMGPSKGASLCCPFHADYEIAWMGAFGVCEMQVCFGCNEARFFARGETFSASLSQEGASAMRGALQHFDRQRPKAAGSASF